jgi:hypothetical protein
VYAGSALSLQDTLGSNDVLMREMLDVHGALREAEAEALATLLQHELIRRVGFAALTSPSQNQEMRQIVQSLGFDR